MRLVHGLVATLLFGCSAWGADPAELVAEKVQKKEAKNQSHGREDNQPPRGIHWVEHGGAISQQGTPTRQRSLHA